ncbi:MAG TPA: hypothetical protein RMH99_00555 [Sandaracinaceae bacterium LLY-WYZ-13_1]|nr:hypothetical protein [Sandaracinaceae bacterium LLY-WYZ-13_1]
MLENHVSVSRDITGFLDWVPVIPTAHQYLSGTTAIPLPMIPNIELPAPIYWPPGILMGQSKLTDTVFHKSWAIALDGHNIGSMLAHIPSAMDDVLTPGHIVLSARKSSFSAGEVKANGKPIAACTIIDIGVMPTPMKQCDLLPTPTTGTGISTVMNDLIVGMHWVDYVAGVLSMLADHVLATLTQEVGGTGPLQMPNALQVVPFLVRLAGQEYFGYAGDAKLELGLGIDPAAKGKVSISRSGEDGRLTAEGRGRLGPEHVGPRATGGGQASWGGTGDRPTTYEAGAGGGVGGLSGEGRYSNQRPGTSAGDEDAAGFYGHGEAPWAGQGDVPAEDVWEAMPGL